MIFLLADIAFIPLEVFFVTLVIDRMLDKREKKHILEKLNMLIGLFFSEIGNKTLKELVVADEELDNIREEVTIKYDSDPGDFFKVLLKFNSHPHNVRSDKLDFVKCRDLLREKRDLLVSMLSNPSLLEHETFADLIQSLFHLLEELESRNINEDLTQMNKFDVDHLTVDIQRVYKHLTVEWVTYMQHMQEYYPYLFVTALIQSPLDLRERNVIEREVMSRAYK
jgi:hypothetical protein